MSKPRILRSALALATAIGALTVAPAAALAAPGGSGPASQANPQATLVRTHVFLPGPPNPARGNGGKPQPAANCTPDDGSSSDPTTYTTTGFKTGGGTAFLNTSTIPKNVNSGAAVTAISGAFGAWPGADSQAPQFTLSAGPTGITKQTANHRTDVLWGSTPGSAIAVTYTWHWSTGEYESDTVFSNRLPWAIVPDIEPGGCNTSVAAYDVQDIATHEFGHIYGLDHDPQRFATMYAYGYTGETLKRSLDLSDSAGIQSLYP